MQDWNLPSASLSLTCCLDQHLESCACYDFDSVLTDPYAVRAEHQLSVSTIVTSLPTPTICILAYAGTCGKRAKEKAAEKTCYTLSQTLCEQEQYVRWAMQLTQWTPNLLSCLCDVWGPAPRSACLVCLPCTHTQLPTISLLAILSLLAPLLHATLPHLLSLV
jgi:hypothetical protein